MTERIAFDVATFGEAMLLLVAAEPGPIEHATMFHRRTAGAETNVAIGLARLGLKVGWASRLGTDSMGRALLATMQAEGIDCSHVICDAAQRTGFQFKGRVTDGSDPPVEYHRKGSAASQMGPTDVDEAWLRTARHLHATGVFPAISASARAAAQKTLDVTAAVQADAAAARPTSDFRLFFGTASDADAADDFATFNDAENHLGGGVPVLVVTYRLP